MEGSEDLGGLLALVILKDAMRPFRDLYPFFMIFAMKTQFYPYQYEQNCVFLRTRGSWENLTGGLDHG